MKNISPLKLTNVEMGEYTYKTMQCLLFIIMNLGCNSRKIEPSMFIKYKNTIEFNSNCNEIGSAKIMIFNKNENFKNLKRICSLQAIKKRIIIGNDADSDFCEFKSDCLISDSFDFKVIVELKSKRKEFNLTNIVYYVEEVYGGYISGLRSYNLNGIEIHSSEFKFD